MLSFAQTSSPTSAAIERVFNALFAERLNTVLIGGAAEPFYRPADDEDARHRIFYREDFVSSSLHEVAHWMVAGEARRLLPDWGYWYAPDGRDAAQQQVFEQMEVKPQALEWLLHAACGLHFRVSLDNLSDGAGDGSAFKDRVYEQACHCIRNGVHERMQCFYQALAETFSGAGALQDLVLSRADLD
jgi:elongation factor P hydroxylase